MSITTVNALATGRPLTSPTDTEVPKLMEAGYYPYVDGLPKIDKNGNTILMKGYTLRLGTLVNGNDCDVKFYRGYDDEDGTLDRPVVSGSKVFTDGSAKVYAQVISGTMKHLDENGLVVSAATGETAEVTQVADGLYMFAKFMPPLC